MPLPVLDAPAHELDAGTAVTVVIATRDRHDLLLETLGRLAGLPEAPDVLVVDDASRDDTARAVAACFPRVAVTTLERSRGAAARNVGVEQSRSRYVALTDDDADWAPGALAAAAAVLDEHPEIGLVAPRVLVGEEERLDAVSLAMATGGLEGGPALPGEPVLGFVACAVVVRRSAFLAVGGFDGRYGVGGEERRLALDLATAGWALRYVPAVVAHHRPPPSAGRPARRAMTLRNDLWTAWLRRPARAATAESVGLLRRAGLRRSSTAAGLAAALVGASWVVRERRVVHPRVEAWLTTLDARG